MQPPTEPAVPPVEASRRHRRELLFTLLVLVLLAVGGSGIYLLWPRTVAISGSVLLTDPKSVSRGGGPFQCTGGGGFGDLQAGTPVTVTDDKGQTIAVGRLDRGTMTYGNCSFPFTVKAPERASYGIKIAERNQIQFTRDEVRHPIEMRIGG